MSTAWSNRLSVKLAHVQVLAGNYVSTWWIKLRVIAGRCTIYTSGFIHTPHPFLQTHVTQTTRNDGKSRCRYSAPIATVVGPLKERAKPLKAPSGQEEQKSGDLVRPKIPERSLAWV